MNSKITKNEKFVPLTVMERTINISPHIVVRLILGNMVSEKGEGPRAAEIQIKNYTENELLPIKAQTVQGLINCLEILAQKEPAPTPQIVRNSAFELLANRRGVSVITRTGNFMLLTRHNYILGAGHRDMVQPLMECIQQIKHICSMQVKWLKREEIIEDNPLGDITTPQLFIRTIATFTSKNQLKASSIVSFLGTNNDGTEYVSTNIHSSLGRLVLGDSLHSYGMNRDIYSRPVPVIIDRLAEGLAVLLDQPSDYITINAQPDTGQFADWDNMNTYVSHSSSNYIYMNCDKYPTYSKVAWRFSPDHMQSIYEAMRELLSHYPSH